MIFIVGAVFAIFYEFLLLSKNDKSLADKILAFWMFLISIHLFTYYTIYTGISFEYPVLFFFGTPMPFVHGPMLFLYTLAITRRPRWRSLQYLHFLPVLLCFLVYYEFLFLSREEKLEYIQRLSAGEIPLAIRFIFPIMIAHAVTYLGLTFILLQNHKRRIKENYSYSDHKIDLFWLRGLLTGLSIIWLVVITANFMMSDFDADVAIYVTVVLFVFCIGFFGIRQGNIFVSVPSVTSSPRDNTIDQKRYSRSGLKEEEAINISERLSKLMEMEKLYKEERLTLPVIAERLKVHPNYLSQVINEHFKKNFYDFINSYRIEEFKNHILLQNHRKMTLFSLALDCGFTSKGAFNSAFKKFTGRTPTEFIQSVEMNK